MRIIQFQVIPTENPEFHNIFILTEDGRLFLRPTTKALEDKRFEIDKWNEIAPLPPKKEKASTQAVK